MLGLQFRAEIHTRHMRATAIGADGESTRAGEVMITSTIPEAQERVGKGALLVRGSERPSRRNIRRSVRKAGIISVTLAREIE